MTGRGSELDNGNERLVCKGVDEPRIGQVELMVRYPYTSLLYVFLVVHISAYER